MRSRLLPTLAASALLLGAATAQAGTLTSATWVTEVMTFPGGPAVPFPVPITATGTSTATSVSVSLTVPGFSHSVFVPGPIIDFDVTLALGGMQLLTATPSMAAATQAVLGSQITKVGAMTPTTLLKVPLRVGVNGAFTTAASFFPGIYHYITVDFYGWTPHTQTVTGLTSNLAPLPDVIAKGSFNLTANGGGTITLVSPSKITDTSSLPYRTMASLTTLKLTFVPEPGTLLLLVAGGAALAMHWRLYGNTR